ncbi:MAG: MATE family efflux transporter [Candidatus Babeliales bacterium]|jgi:MATE family, multidrug efflux pump
MKKGLLANYVASITNIKHGESYYTILNYFFFEYITNLVLYALPFWLDATFIGQLESTITYATLGVTNNFVHLVIKIAEALSVGTVVLSGQFNGRNDYHFVGRTIRDAFWVTCVVGFLFFLALYNGAYWIYFWYGVSEEVISLGVPFLQLRAISVLFMFVYFALIGFLRGIKNTKTPMKIFMAGAIIFIFFDYALIFGKWGFPAMGLKGSAIASLLQYGFMFFVALCYIIFDNKNRKYGISLFSVFNDVSYVKKLLHLSWPVVLDKAAVALAYVWLGKMIASMGTCGLAAFCVVKDMERFAIIPATAFAHVITFLVSNDFGIQNWEGIKGNIKKIIFICSIIVGTVLILFSCWPEYIIQLFDKKGEFTELAARAFPILSILAFFDLLQLILSGATRGTGSMRIVMHVRLVIVFCYFIPLSYFLSHLTMQDQTLKFILVYGSFYLGNALMSIVYINRFRGDDWKISSMNN